VKAEKIDYDQKIEKFDGVIGSHQAKIEHWRKEMSKIKLNPVDGEPEPQLQVMDDEELANIRQETLHNTITKTELELGKLAPNLQVIDILMNLKQI
jgi:hypothetical protein